MGFNGGELIKDFVLFVGFIQLRENRLPLKFRVKIEERGEIAFDFNEMPISSETDFIFKEWNSDPRVLTSFSLSGSSDNGMQFCTDDLIFTSLNEAFGQSCGCTMTPVGSCITAQFHSERTEQSVFPMLRMWLKGFQSFRELRAQCSLGEILMHGQSVIHYPDTITGSISITALAVPSNISEWRNSVEKLFEHVRRVMSFASAVILHSPVTEFFDGKQNEIVVWSQPRQSEVSMRVVHYLEHNQIFQVAITSYFSPPVEIKNLFHAIEWFTMDASYNEVKLVNAMTVLENLVASNLDESDSLIMEKRKFDKVRRSLRSVIKVCLNSSPVDQFATISEVVAELDERLGDLNRRSIINKLMMLIDLWSVSLEGIEISQIKAAKKARDQIVHTGHYAKDRDGELWDHAMVIREIVVRFLFTAIGYKGPYISFIGGYHHTSFPPPSAEQV